MKNIWNFAKSEPYLVIGLSCFFVFFCTLLYCFGDSNEDLEELMKKTESEEQEDMETKKNK